MGNLYDITFKFDKCHRSWAAETPDKHECDLKYLTYTFAKSQFPVTEKLMIGALMTPPQVWSMFFFRIKVCHLVIMDYQMPLCQNINVIHGNQQTLQLI